MPGNVASNKVPEIEAVRGAASLYVVLHHLTILLIPFIPKILLAPFLFGQEAVIVFFLLSGYVIKLSWLRRPNISFQGYFWARWRRIYPILVFAIIVTTIAVVISGKAVDVGQVYSQAAGNLLFLQDRKTVTNIVPAYLENSPLWSLSYEWFFYFLFFIVARYLGRTMYVAGAVIALAATAVYLPTLNPIARFIMYWPIWMLGATLADGKDAKQGRSVTLAAIGIIAVAFLYESYLSVRAGNQIDFAGDPFLQARHFAFALLALPMMASVMWVYGKVRHAFVVRSIINLLAGVGTVSYSLYVLHYPVLVLATQTMPDIIRIAMLAVGVPMLLALCYFGEFVLQPWVNSFRFRSEKTA